MKLTLKQQWRPRPIGSFLGYMDIKLGVTIALLFALLNKVAGVYGLIAVFTGGSFAQLSMYVYSVLALVAFAWGLKAVTEEDPRRTLYFAHLFFADHILSTAWTAFFAVVWWIYTPHDGRRVANSAAQEAMMHGGAGHNMTEAERTEAAMRIWNKEKGTAAMVIVAGWCIKIYFAILLYSYAIHLRKGTYRTLPTSHSPTSAQYMALNGGPSHHSHFPESMLEDYENDVAFEEFYRMPSSASHMRTPGAGGSVTSFADFVSAPGRGRRSKAGGGVGPTGGAGLGKGKGGGMLRQEDVEDEVLFDSDELGGASGHSKFGTEESTSASSREDEVQGRRPPHR